MIVAKTEVVGVVRQVALAMLPVQLIKRQRGISIAAKLATEIGRARGVARITKAWKSLGVFQRDVSLVLRCGARIAIVKTFLHAVCV